MFKFLFLVILGVSLAGCGDSSQPFSTPGMGVSISQKGEGTAKSPKNIVMKMVTPDGDVSINMKATDESFSLFINTRGMDK